MAKFAIACPRCGKYAEAKKFWIFGTKKITCSCGYEIDVNAEKLSSRKCASCGNEVLVDVSKSDNKCPVCQAGIDLKLDQQVNVEVTCEKCGLHMVADKNSPSIECPICGHVNDMKLAKARSDIKNSGLPTVVKYEGDPNVLVWKHPIEDFVFGSQLIVHESQEAVFLRDGQALDSFGPGRHTLETQRLPLISNVASPAVTQGDVFHAEIYYVSMANQMGLKWGTDSKVRFTDPITKIPFEIGASGEFNLRVTDARKFLFKVLGPAREFNSAEILDGNLGQFRSLVMTQVKQGLSFAISQNNINLFDIDAYLDQLSTVLRDKINEKLAPYGLEMSEFLVSRVLLPEDDPNFQRVRQQHADNYLEVREEQIAKNIAEAAQEREIVEATTKQKLKVIDAGGDAEALLIRQRAEQEAQRLANLVEAEKMRTQGYTYQQQTQREVSMEAMKNGVVGGGVAGGGAGSAIGEMASLGIALGTMGTVANVAQNAFAPALQTLTTATAPTAGAGTPPPGEQAAGWDCACGNIAILTEFCPRCGAKKPAPVEGWTCTQCGAQGLTTAFCPQCGSKKPESVAGWTCAQCGTQGLTTAFCPQCGAKKPEPTTGWTCTQCGAKDLTTTFCPQCGTKRAE